MIISIISDIFAIPFISVNDGLFISATVLSGAVIFTKPSKFSKLQFSMVNFRLELNSLNHRGFLDNNSFLWKNSQLELNFATY